MECLQLLLSHNAQVNSVDAAGKTPLMMAAENGQTNAVGTEAWAARRCCNLKSQLALCLLLIVCVSITLLAHCSELLVSSAKADLTLQDAVKNTALHLACTKVGATGRPPTMTHRNGPECLYDG